MESSSVPIVSNGLRVHGLELGEKDLQFRAASAASVRKRALSSGAHMRALSLKGLMLQSNPRCGRDMLRFYAHSHMLFEMHCDMLAQFMSEASGR